MQPKDFRRITTVLLFNKARIKTNKGITNLGQSAIATLLIVGYYQPIAANDILARFSYYRSTKTGQANRYTLLELESINFIESTGYPKQYTITPLGLSYLRTLETNLRKARIDK